MPYLVSHCVFVVDHIEAGLTVVTPKGNERPSLLLQEAPISVITVWGASGVGKTLFGITSPYKPVLVLDTEKGAKPYKVSGLYEFAHLQCLTWMGPSGLKEQFRIIRAGQYGTVMIDTGTQFCDWVAKETFTKAPAKKAEKQSMLVWGDVKHTVRQILMDLMPKTKVIVITAGSRLQKDGETREARILEPIFALSDVFMELRRDPNQRIPYGLTMPPTSKSRIMSLPPRLPQATWESILRYTLEKPADWANLTSDESIPEKLLYPGLDGEQ
jgi:hypothetical protein